MRRCRVRGCSDFSADNRCKGWDPHEEHWEAHLFCGSGFRCRERWCCRFGWCSYLEPLSDPVNPKLV